MATLSAAAALSDLRISARFLRRMECQTPLSLYPESKRAQRPIGAFCLPSTAVQIAAGDLEEPALLVDLEHVGPYGEISDAGSVGTIGSTRMRFCEDQVITTQLRPYLLKTASPPEHAIGSPEWICLHVNETIMRPRLLFYLLTTPRYAELATILSTGKQHPRISLDTLQSIEVPMLSLDEQDALLARLEPLLEQSTALLQSVESIRQLIDAAFADEFGLDVRELQTHPGEQSFDLSLTSVADSPDARFSYRYHSPSVRRALSRLRALPHRRLRDLLSEPAVLGDSVSPDDYERATERHYVSMVALKYWRFDTDGLADVSETYFQHHSAKWVCEGDVLMARSGEGTIGKVASVPANISGVCSDFVIRMRPDQALIRTDFLRYCLTSSFYQHLVFGEKKGLGNNTNIFPVQLHNFPMLSLPLEQQDRICDRLSAAVSEADANARRAHLLRAEIQDLIERTVSD